MSVEKRNKKEGKRRKENEDLGENFDERMEEGEDYKIFPDTDKKKSCFKREDSPQKSRAVKITDPQPESRRFEDIINREIKERRKRRPQFKTVKDPKELKNDAFGMKDGKFVRKSKRSTTLVEKSKLSDKLLMAEMSLTVKQDILVGEEKGNPSKKYKARKMLGSGSFGCVYEAKNTLFGNIVAMKVIKKDKDNEEDEQEIRNEIDILKQLSHPNIVKIYEFFISENHYYIITEFCKEGELFNYIKNKYSERQLAVLFYQVFSGLWYLHENKILHRDIKLENIMIAGKENDNATKEELFWAKIIDFGTAKIFEKNKKEKDVVGSSYYIAPEVLKQEYNEKCDTWSVGVILYMTLVGRAPFDGKDDEEIINKINTIDYNKNEPRLVKHSPEVRDLVSKLLEKNIEKRYSAKEALAHPWFEKFGGRALFSNFEESEVKPFINNLLNYSYNSKIQQLVIAFLVHNLPSTDSSILILKLFRHFNKSGNCKLSKEELTEGLYNFRSKEEIDKIIDKLFIMLDGDNDGFIEFEEFLRACINRKQILTPTYLKYAFKFIDKDKTNTLNVQKIINAFVTTPNKLLEAVFNNTLISVDKDGDGVIGFEEFQELMLKCMN